MRVRALTYALRMLTYALTLLMREHKRNCDALAALEGAFDVR